MTKHSTHTNTSLREDPGEGRVGMQYLVREGRPIQIIHLVTIQAGGTEMAVVRVWKGIIFLVPR